MSSGHAVFIHDLLNRRMVPERREGWPLSNERSTGRVGSEGAFEVTRHHAVIADHAIEVSSIELAQRPGVLLDDRLHTPPRHVVVAAQEPDAGPHPLVL